MQKALRLFLPLAIFCAYFVVAPLSARCELVELKIKHLEQASRFMRSPSEADFLFKMVQTQNMMYDNGMNSPNLTSAIEKAPTDIKGKYPFKGVVQLGSKSFGYLMDGEDIENKGYEILYFDINGNGDLTDDTPLKANPIPNGIQFGNQSAQREFPKITVKIESDGTTYEHTIFASVYTSMNVYTGEQNRIYAYASFQSGSYREGEATLAGKKRRIVLLDFNSNGKYNDKYEVNKQISASAGRFYANAADTLFIDPPTSNQSFYGYGLTDLSERFPVSNVIAIDGKYYDISINAQGTQLKLEPSKVALGAVKNPNKKYQAVVFNDQTVVKIEGGNDKPIALPEGKWQLLEYNIDESDSNQSRTFVSAFGSSESPVVTVKKGETVSLPFGPPYVPVVDVRNYPSENGQKRVRLEMTLKGSGGERCTNLQVDGNRPPDPTFAIATASNEIVERGNFEYG